MSAATTTEQEAPFAVGPLQMIVVGFAEDTFTGKILPELRRLNELDVVRLVDLLVVAKDDEGEIDVHQISDLDEHEATQFGALIGALVGLGTGRAEEVERAATAGAAELEDGHLFDEQAVWYLSDAIPAGTAAAIALIEHRWAIPLRQKIVEAGGRALADEWIHPADLIAVGKMVAQQKAAAARAR
jgi:uncharacterized membrane protein